jgi:hypothetical protein
MKSVATSPQRVVLAGIVVFTTLATGAGAHLASAQTQTPAPTLTLTPQVATTETPAAQTQTPVAQTPVPTPTLQPIATQPALTPTAAIQTPAPTQAAGATAPAAAPGAQVTYGPQIFVVTSTPQPAAARPLNVAGVNLLTNPGHEHPGANFAGRTDVNVTWNWNPFWEGPPSGVSADDPNYRTPEFSATFARDNKDRVRSQAGSDRWRNRMSVNKQAGIMQYVADLPVGAPIRFTSWVQLWSNDDDTVTAAESKRSDLKVRACIDQDGGPRDLTDPNLVCSDWKQPFGAWEQLSVDGIAKNSVANVLIWSAADTPVLVNDVYADESCFEILSSSAAKGICAGAGLIETGPNVQALPANVGSIKITAEEQARLSKALLGTPVAIAAAAATPNTLTAPSVITPSLAVNARVFMNVRQQPSQTAAVATTARRGAVLPVLGKSTDGKWFQVELDGATGWVLSSLTLPNAGALAAPVVE